MNKTVQLSTLQALTGAVNRKMDEGAWQSPDSGVVYHFDTLSSAMWSYLQDKCTDNGMLLQNLFLQWVCRAAWRACTAVDPDNPEAGPVRMDIPQESVRFNGPTPDGSGFVSMATWESVAALGGDRSGLAVAIAQHVVQQDGDRQRLGFTDGSYSTDSPVESHTETPAANAADSASL